jgi:LacI family transcriptional regulator
LLQAAAGTYSASHEKRERVLSVVERLGYRPNLLARSLRRGRTHAILLVVPKLSQ